MQLNYTSYFEATYDILQQIVIEDPTVETMEKQSDNPDHRFKSKYYEELTPKERKEYREQKLKNALMFYYNKKRNGKLTQLTWGRILMSSPFKASDFLGSEYLDDYGRINQDKGLPEVAIPSSLENNVELVDVEGYACILGNHNGTYNSDYKNGNRTIARGIMARFKLPDAEQRVSDNLELVLDKYIKSTPVIKRDLQNSLKVIIRQDNSIPDEWKKKVARKSFYSFIAAVLIYAIAVSFNESSHKKKKESASECKQEGGTKKNDPKRGIDSLLGGGNKVITTSIVQHLDESVFRNREDELHDLTSKIIDKKENVVLMNGFGGIGKSSLARILYHRLKDKFDKVGWIDYRTDLRTSMLSSIILPDNLDNMSPDERWSYICSRLRDENQKYLFFIDNVDYDARFNQDPIKDEQLTFISGLSNVTVVLTSRLEHIECFRGHEYRIEFMSEESCVDLFKYYFDNPVNEEEETAIHSIVSLASCHTYAVEILARSARHSDSLKTFLDGLNTQRFQFPNLKVRTGYGNKQDGNLVASEHLKKLFSLSSITEAQQMVLVDFSLLPYREYTGEEVRCYTGYGQNDLSLLCDYGWLIHKRTYSMHPLVNDSVHLEFKNGMAPLDAGKKLKEGLMDGSLLSEGLDDSYNEILTKVSILDHAFMFLSFASTENEARSHLNFAHFARRKAGQIALAESHYRRALTLYFELSQKDPEKYLYEISVARCELGYQLSYTASGVEDAKILLSDALEGMKELYRINPDIYQAELARVYDRLGYLLSDSDESYELGTKYLRKALELRTNLSNSEMSTEQDVSDEAWTQDNLGYHLLAKQDQLEEAKRLLESALKTRETLYNGNPVLYGPALAWTHHNLGLLYGSYPDKLKESEFHYKKAVTIAELDDKRFPGLHSDGLAIAYNNLACILRASENEKNNAEGFYRLALELYKARSNANAERYSGEVSFVANNLATLLQFRFMPIETSMFSEFSKDLTHWQPKNEIEELFKDALLKAPLENDRADILYNLGWYYLLVCDSLYNGIICFSIALDGWKRSRPSQKDELDLAEQILQLIVSISDDSTIDRLNLINRIVLKWLNVSDMHELTSRDILHAVNIIYSQSGARKRQSTVCRNVLVNNLDGVYTN